MNKRLFREIKSLYQQQTQKQLTDPCGSDYIIDFDETNIKKVRSLIKGPLDSVYRHKFIRLDFEIPDDYPYSPPSVTFINYDNVRIHPNMYEDGKCCLTILNTWGNDKYEKWTSSMGIETILLAFQSFLDNNPYTHEPGDGDDPSYTTYVKYQSWISCLIRYLENENIPSFVEMIHKYLLKNIDTIFAELDESDDMYPYGVYYTKCFEIEHYGINYDGIKEYLKILLTNHARAAWTDAQTTRQRFDKGDNTNGALLEEQNASWTCNICFDTCSLQESVVLPNELESAALLLECGHQFHRACIIQWLKQNGNMLCPMCRAEVSEDMQKELGITQEEEELWMINPLTKRRIKVGGRTWLYLMNNDFL